MPLKHLIIIFIIVAAWGFSYVTTKLGLQGAPPLLFGALRFSTLIIPAFFIPFPKIKFSWLIIYSFVMFFCQFSFLFFGIAYGMPAGLASLVMQSQVFFTIIMSAFFLKEHIKPSVIIGLSTAVLGILIIAGDIGTNMTMIGLSLTLCAALSWATGNILTKKLQPVDALSLTIWGSLLAIPPLLITSVIFEGIDTIQSSLVNINLTTILAIFYLGLIATFLAYGLWAKMLTRYEANIIAPFSLLSPVFGLSSCAVFLDEHLTKLEIIGSIVVMLGLFINVFGYKLIGFFKRHQ